MSKSSRLQVIGAGFCRTGTMSTKTALDKLGYNTHHMFEVIDNIETQGPLWLDVAAGNPNWDELFEGYSASVDFPSFWWYKELAQKYPDAKVILNIRDPEKWYQSSYSTVYPLYKAYAALASVKEAGDPNRLIADVSSAIIWGPTGCFQDKFEDKDWVISLYKHHIEEVKRIIPAERLLIFQVTEGWAPICSFLGKPIPNEPFPHMNDTVEMRERANALLMDASLDARDR
ncbi:hypothetical protein K493DRAFT_201281 [Basidiobolus meristosporus CBS 931.73]|uniref:P-loop containing nucleoside triphosphate hydrolase protein n=1 Tax=Basidiobolus meristosporus CBS 931.73 TaxID=1314790 RepID=A0A1Y1ZD40_9FUNG|nr:hypothetical protein K493DRAFT_201281 [Basidiobolus meristosporus CBS 931.73]|eukprot:ORY08116.1 hypothetical protein K493DRAFT_201281 [Basidiobolus meristosporus CBS 931.73]